MAESCLVGERRTHRVAAVAVHQDGVLSICGRAARRVGWDSAWDIGRRETREVDEPRAGTDIGCGCRYRDRATGKGPLVVDHVLSDGIKDRRHIALALRIARLGKLPRWVERYDDHCRQNSDDPDDDENFNKCKTSPHTSTSRKHLLEMMHIVKLIV